MLRNLIISGNVHDISVLHSNTGLFNEYFSGKEHRFRQNKKYSTSMYFTHVPSLDLAMMLYKIKDLRYWCVVMSIKETLYC